MVDGAAVVELSSGFVEVAAADADADADVEAEISEGEALDTDALAEADVDDEGPAVDVGGLEVDDGLGVDALGVLTGDEEGELLVT